jgi:tetratricopeptide (TPR) repeat protein
MSGFVVCPNCGARIKAGRGHCLRCFETLPVEGAEEAPQAWYRSLQVSQGTTLIAGVALTLAALLVSALIWEKATPEPAADDVARPAPSVVSKAEARAPGGGPASAASITSQVPPPILEPGFVPSARATTLPASTGDFTAARQTYEQALVQRPDDPDALSKLGQVLVRLGKIDEAIPRFERAAALQPDQWSHHFNLAHAASQLLLWDQAVAEYRRATALLPADYATQFDLALALHKKGDEAAAVPEFEKAIKLAPSEAKAHVSLAISLEKLGRVPDAVRAYRRFLEMDPGSPEAEKIKAHVESLGSAQPSARP